MSPTPAVASEVTQYTCSFQNISLVPVPRFSQNTANSAFSGDRDELDEDVEMDVLMMMLDEMDQQRKIRSETNIRETTGVGQAFKKIREKLLKWSYDDKEHIVKRVVMADIPGKRKVDQKTRWKDACRRDDTARATLSRR